VAGALIAGISAVALVAAPAVATDTGSSTTTTPPSTAAPVVAATGTTTLPLFGVQLTVEVSTTPSGSLASVTVDPNTGLTATKVKSNSVVFVNDANTGKVRVETRHGSEKTGVAAGALADIVGPGGWSGDVFGTGTTTTVSFNIVANPDGSPDITGITSSDPSAVIGTVQHRSSDHAKVARATVTFTSGIQSRRLTITATVFTMDGNTRAASQVTLSRVSGVALPANQAAGDHTWTGMLCDGSTASVSYTVAADGTITAGAVTPSGATAKAFHNVLFVRFSDTESLSIFVQHKDGDLRISALPILRCQRAIPTVNTPTSTTAVQGDRHFDPPRSSDQHRWPGHRSGDH
jgi:hypothetical protein